MSPIMLTLTLGSNLGSDAGAISSSNIATQIKHRYIYLKLTFFPNRKYHFVYTKTVLMQLISIPNKNIFNKYY